MEIAFPQNANLVVLSRHHIGGYDYVHSNDDDDFRLVVDAILKNGRIVFATPVYWYAMSAPLKIFFDRLTDLLETAKASGRALRGKKVWMIASGTEDALPDGFEVPFRRTCEYFSMDYCGCAYLYTGDDTARRVKSEAALADFGAGV